MTNYYKEKIGQEDINFGTGQFTRRKDNAQNENITQLNKSHIPRSVLAKTADFTIDKNTYVGEVTFTNEGATATITFTLPTAKAGLGVYTFLVLAAYQLRVDPVGTDNFRDCANAKYKYSSTVGNILRVWCDTNGVWEYDYEVVSGVWDNES